MKNERSPADINNFAKRHRHLNVMLGQMLQTHRLHHEISGIPTPGHLNVPSVDTIVDILKDQKFPSHVIERHRISFATTLWFAPHWPQSPSLTSLECLDLL